MYSEQINATKEKRNCHLRFVFLSRIQTTKRNARGGSRENWALSPQLELGADGSGPVCPTNEFHLATACWGSDLHAQKDRMKNPGSAFVVPFEKIISKSKSSFQYFTVGEAHLGVWHAAFSAR